MGPYAGSSWLTTWGNNAAAAYITLTVGLCVYLPESQTVLHWPWSTLNCLPFLLQQSPQDEMVDILVQMQGHTYVAIDVIATRECYTFLLAGYQCLACLSSHNVKSDYGNPCHCNWPIKSCKANRYYKFSVSWMSPWYANAVVAFHSFSMSSFSQW